VRRNDSLARFLNQRPQQEELVQRHIIPAESEEERLEHRQQIGATLNRQGACSVFKTTFRVTTCLENLPMSGNLTAVRKMSGILLNVREVSGEKLVREKWPKTVYC